MLQIFQNYLLLYIFLSKYAVLQAEMDTLVEQMKIEREMYEKAQEEQEVIKKRWMTTAAICIQTHFRGYRYENFNIAIDSLHCSVFCSEVCCQNTSLF